MNKYIDAEKFIKEFEKMIDDIPASVDSGAGYVIDKVYKIITSLQQEQPMPDSTKLIELWHEDKEMLKEKDFRDDPWRLAYNAFMCGFGRGLAVKQKEQQPTGEDEDERIRKAALEGTEYLERELCWDAIGDTDILDVKEYLEKQKEQKPVEVREPSDDELERYQKELYDFKVFAAKQAREHHISFVHDFEWNNFCAELLSYFNEQKPAEWGEEDEECLNAIINVYQGRAELNQKLLLDHKIPKNCNFDARCLSFLKSLRPQPKQEWSEDYREEDIQTRFAFYTYKDDPSVLYLSNVFVEETSRNHGFGTRILKAAEKVAETIGAITICLKVKQDSPANAWYRKHGYGYVTFEDGYDWLEKNLEYLKPAKSTEWSEEDIITIHLGRVVTEELYDQIVKDTIKLLDRKYSVNAKWHLDS